MSRHAINWVSLDTKQPSSVELPTDGLLHIGRATYNHILVTGDPSVSRKHATARVVAGELLVECLEGTMNPIVFNGEGHRQIKIPAGADFRIGDTPFKFVALGEAAVAAGDRASAAAEWTKAGVRETTYTSEQLSRADFGNAKQQIEILANLPRLIADTQSDQDLAVQVSQLLLQGIPQAEAVAVVRYAETDVGWTPDAAGDPPVPSLLRVQTRSAASGKFQPSRRLMLKCLATQQSAMHITEDDGGSQQFTMMVGLGWAFASPIRGEACKGWCLYVSGKGGPTTTTEQKLQGDLRFTELLAQFIGSVRQVRTLQAQRTQLSAFFSPKVIENLTASAHAQAADLVPAEREITVLFCDLRGFSKVSEKLQHDLAALLRTVSGALGVMATGVLQRDGAIADFQGDAVLGFWGWPIPDVQGPWPACRAALAIVDGFQRANVEGHSLLTGLSAGIGVAHGKALAGRIGTEQQAKIGVFGPVVNQGSRLEGMTKQFGVSVCIDHAAATYLRQHVPAGEARTRKLARVRPKGMDTAIEVHELVPPQGPASSLTQDAIAAHEAAVEAVIAGRWTQARDTLKSLPETDGPANFLRAFLQRSAESPPADWDGTIRLESK